MSEEAKELQELLQVGDVVHGFCGGILGGDWYSCGRVEARGTDWAVIRKLGDGEEPTLALAVRHQVTQLRKYRKDDQYPHTCGAEDRGEPY